ncbi:hypothetical protein ANCCEY_14396 [Ancylostoma ceylanicum]|uniref:Uncharacterized protein n=2 Tax=Ancylostoma ceylanicum TaxID=53326 RepID=A0A0D6L5L5_9BILA|nr:hypothetical protein ANCCEY_14396 [Ancylostoma ceylanicum]EYC25471.1 hypothetical protein Y032_0012g1913 [Ancylostoma ceylanicum]
MQAVKYLYKYVYKGLDRAFLRLLQGNGILRLEEICAAHLDARYVFATKAIYHIHMFECQFKSDTVYRRYGLQVHFPDSQTVTFLPDEEKEALQREGSRDTILTSSFKLNVEYDWMVSENTDIFVMVDLQTLYFHQLPEHFTFVQTTRKWKPRAKGNRQIGRMFMATPIDHERFSLRLALGEYAFI